MVYPLVKHDHTELAIHTIANLCHIEKKFYFTHLCNRRFHAQLRHVQWGSTTCIRKYNRTTVVKSAISNNQLKLFQKFEIEKKFHILP